MDSGCRREVRKNIHWKNKFSADFERSTYRNEDHFMRKQLSTENEIARPMSRCSGMVDNHNGPLEESFRKYLYIDDVPNDETNSKFNYWRPSYNRGYDSGVESCASISRSCSYDSVSSASTSNKSCLHQETVAVDSTLQRWELPTLKEQLAIIQQVEYYFSDDYLARDAYFLRQIRRKREGYLSMRLITNFKKIRKIVSDPRITAYSLRKSKLLQVNREGTKVRRIAEVQWNTKRILQQCEILVIGIPAHLAKIETVMAIFSRFGDMTSVHLIRPDRENWSSSTYAKRFRSKLMPCALEDECRDQLCSVIEFQDHEAAAEACQSMASAGKDYGFSKVILAGNGESKPYFGNPDSPKKYETKPYDLDWRTPTPVPYEANGNFNSESQLRTQIHDKEQISDDAWIQNVVNQVLQQTHKQTSADDNEVKAKCVSLSDYEKAGNDYMLLHAS